jgi:hypothetical protein
MQQTRCFHFHMLLLTVTLAIGLGGCGKNVGSSGKSSTRTTPQQTATSTASPLLDPILVSWKQGDQAGAVQQFIKTDGKGGLFFGPDSPLSHRESDLSGLSQAARDKLMKEVMAHISDVKALAAAVRNKGQAVAGTDPELARQCFARLDELGAALDQPEGMVIIQLVGRAVRKMAAAETAKLGK